MYLKYLAGKARKTDLLDQGTVSDKSCTSSISFSKLV